MNPRCEGWRTRAGRCFGWLTLLWGLLAAVALAPVNEVRSAFNVLGQENPPWPKDEAEARLHGTVASLVAAGADLTTYGAADGKTRDTEFYETVAMDYVLLPERPMRSTPPPVASWEDAHEALLGVGPHPQHGDKAFREMYPYRRKAWQTHLYSRKPFPPPCPQAAYGTTPEGGIWHGLVGGLVLVVAAPLMAGWVFAFPAGAAGDCIRRVLIAWALGIAMVCVFFFMVGRMTDMGPGKLALMLGVAGIVLAVMRVWCGREGVPRYAKSLEDGRWIGVPLACALLVFVVALLAAVSSRTHVSIPAMCNWAYKAKLLFLSGSWPEGWFDVFDGPNRQPQYPPGFPVLSAVFFTGAGRVADDAVRVLPPLWLGASCWICAASATRAGWRPATAGLVLLCLACFMNSATHSMASSFYAEPMLALFLCLALADVTGRENPGEVGLVFWLLLAGAAWVKPEGAAVFALAALALPLLAWWKEGKRRAAWRQLRLAGGIALVLVAPWYGYVVIAGGTAAAAIDGNAQIVAERTGTLVAELARRSLPMWRGGGGLGWVFVPALAVVIWHRDWRAVFCLVLALGLLAGAVGRMALCSEPLEWYASSLHRIFWLPAIAALFALLPNPDPPPAP